MTPAQMLATIKSKAVACTDCDDQEKTLEELIARIRITSTVGMADYATSMNLTAMECLKLKQCPICGAKGKLELDMTSMKTELFWCNRHSGHVYEIDHDLNTADRIPMS